MMNIIFAATMAILVAFLAMKSYMIFNQLMQNAEN